MTNPTAIPRGRQRELRQEQFLEVAVRLFSRNGLEGTTTKDIAREAGVSPGLIYHYYPSKEELLVAVVAHNDPVSDLRPLLEAQMEGSIADALPRVLRGISDSLEKRRDFLWLCMRAAGRFPTVAQALKETKEQVTELLGGFFQARVATGELRPYDYNRLAWGIYNTMAMEHLAGAPKRGDMDNVVEVLLYGLLPRD